jgi:hypothetical protein
MCPACLAAAATTVVSVAAGASSVGGVAAIVVARLAVGPNRATDGDIPSSEGENNGAAENRVAR